jgi:hypothetical protein
MANFLINNAQTITANITLASLASGSARQGNYVDFGETREKQWVTTLQTAVASAPNATSGCEVYLAFGSGTGITSFAAGASGVDSAYAGPDDTFTNGRNQLSFIGYFPTCATTGLQTVNIGTFMPVLRYATPIVYNILGQALSSVANNHILSFTSIKDKTG